MGNMVGIPIMNKAGQNGGSRIQLWQGIQALARECRFMASFLYSGM
jgi:hypothetical protein